MIKMLDFSIILCLVCLPFFYFCQIDVSLYVYCILIVFLFVLLNLNSRNTLIVTFVSIFYLYQFSRPLLLALNMTPFQNSNLGEFLWELDPSFNFAQDTMLNLYFALSISFLFVILAYRTYKPKALRQNITLPSSIYRVGRILFPLGVIGYLIKSVILINVASTYGYTYLYSGNYEVSIFIKLLSNFMYFGYVCLVCQESNPKKILLYTILLLLFLSTSLLSGMRAEFFPILITVLLYCVRVYGSKVNPIRFVGFALALISMGAMSKLLKHDIELVDYANPLDMASQFIWEQGVSVLVPGFIIHYENIFMGLINGLQVLLSPFMAFFYSALGIYQSRELMDPYELHLVGEMLQFVLDPLGYYIGSGTGSSFVAEMLTFGIGSIPVILFSSLIGCIIRWFDSFLTKSAKVDFIYFIVFPAILFSPRSTAGGILMKLIFAYLLLFLFAGFSKIATYLRNEIQMH